MVINNGLVGTLLPLYVTERLLLPITQYSILISASTVGSITGNIFVGFLSDRVGRKKMLLTSLIIGAVSLFSLSIATAFIPLLIIMFMKGIFWGMIYGTTPAFIADSVPNKSLGMAIGTFRTFLDFGGLIGPIALTTFVEQIGYENGYVGAFYLSSILMVICLSLTTSLKDITKNK